MRLTLRTLLAWLDDTLPSAQVRQIGQQVNESTFARELVERIHRVTRQRRLTTPDASGPNATDPNVVAEYLDNLLPPEEVNEFEKLCLKSDVHLAEVASVHQILSLLGQKAKVPPEARHRMYRLLKGREAGRPNGSRVETVPQHEPAAALPPWNQPEPPKPSWIERFGPALAVLGLIVLLCLSTYLSLAPEEQPKPVPGQALANGPAPAAPNVAEKGKAADLQNVEKGKARPPAVADAGNAPKAALEAGPVPEGKAGEAALEAVPAEAPPSATTPEGAMPEGADAAASKDQAKPGAPAPSEEAEPGVLPQDVLGKAVGGEGVLLQRNGPEAPWERVTEQTALRPEALLVGLDPFRNAIELGEGRVVLVKGAAVRLKAPKRDAAASLELLEGRVVLRGTSPPKRYDVALGSAVIGIVPPTGGRVGVERINRLAPGEPKPADPVLRVSGTDGTVQLSSTAGSETLKGGESIQFTAQGGFQQKKANPAPSWLSESSPPVVEQEAGRQFARFFGKDTPPLTGLVEATVDPRPEMRKLAIEALGTVGQVPLVVGAFNTQGDDQAELVRRAAIEAMRSLLARGGPPAQELHDELVLAGGSAEWADQVAKLLAGYTPEEARDPAIQKQLVELLESPDPDVGVRELAILNLMAISNRADALGYDPETPAEGEGLKHWQELLERGEIHQKAANP